MWSAFLKVTEKDTARTASTLQVFGRGIKVYTHNTGANNLLYQFYITDTQAITWVTSGGDDDGHYMAIAPGGPLTVYTRTQDQNQFYREIICPGLSIGQKYRM